MDCNKTNCMECKFGGQSDGCHFDENSYNQALEDFATALFDGEQNEEFVYNIEKIVERLRK